MGAKVAGFADRGKGSILSTMKRLNCFLLAALAGFGLISAPFAHAQTEVIDNALGDEVAAPSPETYYKGVVKSVGELQVDELFPEEAIRQVRVEIKGDTSGWTVDAEWSEKAGSDADDLKVGDKVAVVRSEAFPGEVRYIVTDIYRIPALAILLLIFFAGAIIFAGKRGVTSILGLAFSLVVLLKYTVPAIVGGSEPFFVATVSVFVIAIVSLTVAHGFNKQTGIALGSTLVTLVLSLGLSELFVRASHLLGRGTEEAFYLQFSGRGDIDLRGLLLAGIVIGVLGVLDDVTTTQTAAVRSLAKKGKHTFIELYREAALIGKEHIVSLVNTLALAYAGASLPLLLAFSINESRMPFWVVLNGEVVAEEVVRTLIGSTALVLAVPISTLIATWVYTKYPRAAKGDDGHAHAH